jgi:hypothetical protein
MGEFGRWMLRWKENLAEGEAGTRSVAEVGVDKQEPENYLQKARNYPVQAHTNFGRDKGKKKTRTRTRVDIPGFWPGDLWQHNLKLMNMVI